METLQIYICEIETQVTFAKKAFEEFIAALERSDVHFVFYHAHHFLTHAVMIGKFIDVKPGSIRASCLGPLFHDTGLDLKHFRRLRNHLEHFDERLDDWMENFSGRPYFDMNIITGAIGFPNKAFLRAVDGHVFRFYGESYDLDLLRSEIDSIIGVLQKKSLLRS